MSSSAIVITATIQAPVALVWQYYTQPAHITRWNFATPEWYCPWANADLQPGGTYTARMEAKDGSFGFDFSATYHTVNPHQLLAFTLTDGRQVSIAFKPLDQETQVTVTFEPEQQNPLSLQQTGWQMILDNFKNYAHQRAQSTLLCREYKITIQAPAALVYDAMLGLTQKQTYESWTAHFSPTCSYEGSWNKGANIQFTAIHEGKKGGITSTVVEHLPQKYIALLHTGLIEDGTIITDEAKIAAWKNAQEIYTFIDQQQTTHLIVNIDISPDYQSYFDEVYPKALLQLKVNVESVTP
jgi:uncharacterized protein YndB with AHSA1/START domain